MMQFSFQNLLYKDESVYVRVYVRRPAAGSTQAITPKFGVGSSFHPGSTPSQGATQNVGPQGYLPYWPRLKFPEGLWIGRGPVNKSCSLGWVCHFKFYYWGLTPTTCPQGPLHQMGVFAMKIGRGPANKSWSSGWVCLVKFNLWGLTPTPGPQGPLHQMGVFAMRIGWGPASKSCSSGWVCHVKFYLWGGSPQPRAHRVHSTEWGCLLWELVGGQQTKVAPRGGFAW